MRELAFLRGARVICPRLLLGLQSADVGVDVVEMARLVVGIVDDEGARLGGVATGALLVLELIEAIDQMCGATGGPRGRGVGRAPAADETGLDGYDLRARH
jgi:hypothetical protein